MKLLITTILTLCSLNIYAQRWGWSLDCNINAQDNGGDYARVYRTMPREATVKLVIDRLCTGTLLNQKTSDGKLHFYLLTARHCSIGVNFDVPHTLYFNYQSPDGINSNTPLWNQGQDDGQTNPPLGKVDGHEYRHDTRLRLIGHYERGDFSLIEIMTPIPPHFNISYSGWNSSMFFDGIKVGLPDYHFDPYVGIHHPRGDIKKIRLSSN